MAGKKTAERFEDRMARLEALVERMESGAVPLEELLKDYETAGGLLAQMEKELEQARQKLTILRTQADGTEREEPLEDEA
ncbi:MAG: exodeoxyribonuclease VII small subunit [Clostridia bacterium]|nr:exodeoxyribonuclease VII small subunit [Clostridia bacterium]